MRTDLKLAAVTLSLGLLAALAAGCGSGDDSSIPVPTDAGHETSASEGGGSPTEAGADAPASSADGGSDAGASSPGDAGGEGG